MIRLASLLRRLADSLDPPPPPVVVVEPDHAFLSRVRSLIQAVERVHIDGEARRHQVYARLIKDYPDARKRDLAYAIEQVLQERP